MKRLICCNTTVMYYKINALQLKCRRVLHEGSDTHRNLVHHLEKSVGNQFVYGRNQKSKKSMQKSEEI